MCKLCNSLQFQSCTPVSQGNVTKSIRRTLKQYTDQVNMLSSSDIEKSVVLTIHIFLAFMDFYFQRGKKKQSAPPTPTPRSWLRNMYQDKEQRSRVLPSCSFPSKTHWYILCCFMISNTFKTSNLLIILFIVIKLKSLCVSLRHNVSYVFHDFPLKYLIH